ncbi:MAG TPA: OmpH family outer membrane protein [Candidatus Wallbacteria bacterium]|nr:OmpH family outer membrane protein [Candidatus Wallbacteria bacterium]
MKRSLGLIAVLFLVLITATAVYSKPIEKVGLVNYQQILGEFKEAEAMNEKLMQDKDTLQAQLDKAQDAIKEKKDKFDKKTKATDAEKEKFNKEFSTEITKLQGTYQELSGKLQDKQVAALKTLTEKINAAIATIAKAEGLDMVVEKNLVFFGGTDITKTVIEKLNGGKSTGKKKDEE